MTETELKFLVGRHTASRLRKRLTKFPRVHSVRQRNLRAIYFDTPDLKLREAGYSLRLRLEEDGWVQTVKFRQPMRGGLSRAIEVDTPVPRRSLDLSAIADDEIRCAIENLAGSTPLLPVCETLIKRVSAVAGAKGGTKAEISIDDGEIIAGPRRAPIREVEIELIEGEVASLYRLAADLLDGKRFRFSRLSKAQRGYLLASDGRIDPQPAHRKAMDVPVDCKADIYTARREILRECLDQIALNIEAVREHHDPEGPHQLRIGLRRLRSALSIFRQVTPRRILHSVRKDARWLGRVTGPLRDADVALEMAQANGAPDHKLAKKLARKASRERKRVRKVLNGPRVHRFLLEVAHLCESPLRSGSQRSANQTDLPAFVSCTLDRCWSEVERDATALENINPELLHQLRKEVKRLRYASELSFPLFPGQSGGPIIEEIKKLQDILGELNDAVVFERLLARGGKKRRKGASVAHGHAGEENLRDKHAEAQDLWASISAGKRFWM